jgi:hypothetical protein
MRRMAHTSATATKKTTAIQAFHGSIEFGDNKQIKLNTSELAQKIRDELMTVINSPKWRSAVEGYAQFVEAHPDATNWAYFQGSVYFAYDVC